MVALVVTVVGGSVCVGGSKNSSEIIHDLLEWIRIAHAAGEISSFFGPVFCYGSIPGDRDVSMKIYYEHTAGWAG